MKELSEVLKDGVCEVIFTKVNGVERTMRCTLRDSYIPTVSEDKSAHSKVKAKSSDVYVVWSIEDKDWRSFRKDSVISYRVLDG